MADDKKTQVGTAPGAIPRSVAAAPTPVDLSKAKTSYLADVPDPLIGATIANRYRVTRKLGEGGMGSVYLATHTILEKEVALKVLHVEFARKPDLVERFMQEAKAASRIRHENVIDISDFGATPEGYVFFAMELLTGHDLHEDISRARLAGELLPWARTKKIFLQICNALSAAHARGIVHRDLKPENVYLVPFLDDPDFVKLLDFGIAKVTDVSQEEGARKLTKTGMLFGTPEYMSPEQARGEHVDHRVDIYAMGCILFQLVTTRVPFETDNFMGVLSMHLTEQPPQIPPQIFDRIGAPRALGGVIDKALIKDRNRRYQTIDEFANAVRKVSGDPIPADKSGPQRAPGIAAPEPVRREPSNRVRTQWKGELKIPELADETPRKRSKLPLVIGALVLIGGGAVAAALVLRGGDANERTTPAPVVAQPQPTPPPPPAPEPAPKQPAPPAHAEVSIKSTPSGATVIDVATNAKVGKTPYRATLDGSHDAHRYKLTLAGYGETTVEVVPDQAKVEVAQKLEKVAVATSRKPAAGGTPTTGAVTKPDRSEEKKTEKKEPDCGDDIPCLKPMPK